MLRRRPRRFDTVIEFDAHVNDVRDQLANVDAWLPALVGATGQRELLVDEDRSGGVLRARGSDGWTEHRWRVVDAGRIDVTSGDGTTRAGPTARSIETVPGRRPGSTLMRMHGTLPPRRPSPFAAFWDGVGVASGASAVTFAVALGRDLVDTRTSTRRKRVLDNVLGMAPFVLATWALLSPVLSDRVTPFAALTVALALFASPFVAGSELHARWAGRRVVALGVACGLLYALALPGAPTSSSTQALAAYLAWLAGACAMFVAVCAASSSCVARSAPRIVGGVALVGAACVLNGVFVMPLETVRAEASSATRMPKFGHLQVESLPAGWSYRRDGDAIDLYQQSGHAWIDTWWRDAAPRFDLDRAIEEARQFGEDHLLGYAMDAERRTTVFGAHEGVRVTAHWWDEDEGRVDAVQDIAIVDGVVYHAEAKVYARHADQDDRDEARRLLTTMRVVPVGGVDTIRCMTGQREEIADAGRGGCRRYETA